MRERGTLLKTPTKNPPNHSVSCQRSEDRTTRAAHNEPLPKAFIDRVACASPCDLASAAYDEKVVGGFVSALD